MFDQDKFRNVHCVNCGERGHIVRTCKNHITSFGIIAYKFIKDTDKYTNKGIESDLKKATYTKGATNIYRHPNSSQLAFLMIQRKDTIGYIDFLRGKYDNNYDQMITCLKQITEQERQNLLTKTFDELWNNLWVNKYSRVYLNERQHARKKYDLIDIKKVLESIPCKYYFNEWGFPKGRRNIKELDYSCAQREFQEETGYTSADYTCVDLPCVEETFIGTNGVKYKHIYYIVEMKKNASNPKIDTSNILQIGEVGNIGWVTYEESVALMRDYDIAKKNAINVAKNLVVKKYNENFKNDDAVEICNDIFYYNRTRHLYINSDSPIIECTFLHG